MPKIDVANAFYRININPTDSIRMGVLFPSKKGERKLIGFPLVLPMGWAESPLAFCAGTETIADLANITLVTNMCSLDVPHRLDVLSETGLDPEKMCTKFEIVNPGSIPGSEKFHDQNPVLVSEFVRDPKFVRIPKFVRDPKFVPPSGSCPVTTELEFSLSTKTELVLPKNKAQ